jgi:malonyl-CoA O-methyltransferase
VAVAVSSEPLHATHPPFQVRLLTPPTDAEPPVPDLDAVAARRWRQLPRARSPWLHEEVASRMADRLQWFRQPPASWLHWEPLTGGLKAHQRLLTMFPQAPCFLAADAAAAALQALQPAGDRSWNPLSWRRAQGPQLARADTRVDMVWANMVLHLAPSPQQLLRQWNSHIQTNGFLMFSCLGPDTLREVRTVFDRHGWPVPHHPFTDMHDWGDMLVRNGFAEPVMDMERLTLTYSSGGAVLDDLRELGRNLHAGRHPGLRTARWRQAVIDALDAGLPRDADGRLSITVEVVYGHAFKAAARPAKGPAGEAAVSMDEMRAMLRSGRR